MFVILSAWSRFLSHMTSRSTVAVSMQSVLLITSQYIRKGGLVVALLAFGFLSSTIS